MTRTRIYRTQRGWTIERRDPSGGSVRHTYPTGEAVLIALDPRNRPKRPAPARPVANLAQAFDEFFASIKRGITQPRRRSDYEKRA